jgi:uncharacterized Zn-binding protein involved in type VI secretion
MSSDLKKGSKTVKFDGGKSAAIKGSEFSRCSGDEPGTAGGIKSSTNMKEATWILYSFDVKIEGKNACRLSDKMMMNHGNTACLAGHLADPVKPDDLTEAESKLWDECTEQKKKYDGIKKEYSDLGTTEYKVIRGRISGGKANLIELIRFRELVGKRVPVGIRLAKERKRYIDMGCDYFDWFNNGKTETYRRNRHLTELKKLNKAINTMQKALRAKI